MTALQSSSGVQYATSAPEPILPPNLQSFNFATKVLHEAPLLTAPAIVQPCALYGAVQPPPSVAGDCWASVAPQQIWRQDGLFSSSFDMQIRVSHITEPVELRVVSGPSTDIVAWNVKATSDQLYVQDCMLEDVGTGTWSAKPTDAWQMWSESESESGTDPQTFGYIRTSHDPDVAIPSVLVNGAKCDVTWRPEDSFGQGVAPSTGDKPQQRPRRLSRGMPLNNLSPNPGFDGGLTGPVTCRHLNSETPATAPLPSTEGALPPPAIPPLKDAPPPAPLPLTGAPPPPVGPPPKGTTPPGPVPSLGDASPPSAGPNHTSPSGPQENCTCPQPSAPPNAPASKKRLRISAIVAAVLSTISKLLELVLDIFEDYIPAAICCISIDRVSARKLFKKLAILFFVVAGIPTAIIMANG